MCASSDLTVIHLSPLLSQQGLENKTNTNTHTHTHTPRKSQLAIDCVRTTLQHAIALRSPSLVSLASSRNRLRSRASTMPRASLTIGKLQGRSSIREDSFHWKELGLLYLAAGTSVVPSSPCSPAPLCQPCARIQSWLRKLTPNYHPSMQPTSPPSNLELFLKNVRYRSTRAPCYPGVRCRPPPRDPILMGCSQPCSRTLTLNS